MRYLEIAVRCGRTAADAVGNLLAEVTGGGYAVDDPMSIIENQATWDISDLVAGDPAWVTVKGWLAEVADVEQGRFKLEEELTHIRQLGLGTIDPPAYAWVQDEDWANAWKAFFKPTRVGERLMIIPSWEEYELEDGDLPLYLDPGMAFGTGTHSTTSLCMRLLEQEVKPGQRVLDVGTGSGILSIAAARLGAGPIVAIDLDPVAVEVAKENAGKNDVQIDVRLATVDKVEEEPCDLVVANIIASIIIDILPDAVHRLKSGGKFLASGIISERKQQVLDAMTNTWLIPERIKEENGWVAILAKKV